MFSIVKTITMRFRMVMLISFLSGLFFTSCLSDDADTPDENEVLVTYEFGKKFEKSDVQNFETYFDQLSTIRTSINTGFSVYDLSYKTENGFGNAIFNSGVALIPSDGNIKGIISYQPGTVFLEENRTTNYNNLKTGTFTYFSFLAANGYIVFAADYAGFGLSKDEKHPYNIPDKLAITAYDFIKAGYEFLDEVDIDAPEKLFVTGYSEGGLSNLALTRLIEEEGQFNVTASLSGAGAYDLAAFSDILKFVISNNLPLNQFVPLLFDSYNSFFLKRPLNTIFAEPYATAIENGLFDGEFDTQGILQNLPATYSELFTPEFATAYVTSQDTEADKVTQDNTYVGNGWIPTTPMLLYTGVNDLAVVPINTQNLAGYYLQNGKQNLEVITDEANHTTGRGSYNKIVLDYFNGF